MECVSCGLLLGSGVGRCPGCGTQQVLAGVTATEAQCVTHPTVQALAACERCGAFVCAACFATDLRVCRPCVPRLHGEAMTRYRAQLSWVNVGIAAQGLVAPVVLLLARQESAAVLLTVLGLVQVVLALVSQARQQLSVVALVACGISSLCCLFLVFSVPLAAVPLALGVLEWRLFARLSRAEQEAFRAAREHR